MIYNKNMKRLSKVIALTFAFNCVSPTLFAYAADATATTSTTASEQSALDAAKAKVAEATKTIEDAVKGTSESKKTVASTTAQTASNNTAILQNAINIIMSKDGRDSYGRQYTAEEKALAAIQVGEQFGLTDKDTLAKMQAQLDDATKVAEEQKVDVPSEVQQAKKLLNAYTEAVATMGSDTLSTILQGTHDPAVELSTLRTLYNKAKVQAQQDCQSATTSKTNAASAVTLAQQSYDNITKAIEESQEEISSLKKNDKVAADTKKSELEKANTALEALKTKQKSAQTALDDAKKASETAVSDEKTKCDTNTLSDDAKAYSKAIAALEMQQVNANSNAKATTATDATTTKNADGTTTATCGSGMTLIQDSNKCCPANQPYYRSGKNGVLGCYSTATDTASTSSTSSSKKDDKDNFSNLLGMMAMMGGFGQNSQDKGNTTVEPSNKKDDIAKDTKAQNFGDMFLNIRKQYGAERKVLQFKNVTATISPQHENQVEHNVNVPFGNTGTTISNVYNLNASGDAPLTLTVKATGANIALSDGKTTKNVEIPTENLTVIVHYFVKADKTGTRFVQKTATGKLGEPIVLLQNDGKGQEKEYLGGEMSTPMPIRFEIIGTVAISNGKNKGSTKHTYMSLINKDAGKVLLGYKYKSGDISISGESESESKTTQTEITVNNGTDDDLNKAVDELNGSTAKVEGMIDGAEWDETANVCKIKVSDESGATNFFEADEANNIGKDTCKNIGSSMNGKTAVFSAKFDAGKDANGSTVGRYVMSGNINLMDENRQIIGVNQIYDDADATTRMGKLAYQATAVHADSGATYPLYQKANGKWYNQDFTEVDPEAWKAETGIDLNDMTLGKDGRVYTKDGKDLTGNGFQDTNIKDMKAKAYEHESRDYMPEGSAVSRIMGFFDTNKKEGESQKAVEVASNKSNEVTSSKNSDTADALKTIQNSMQSATNGTTSTKAKVADNQKKSTVDKVKDFANHTADAVTSYASKFG